jgi:hypothetical protein
LVWAFCKTGPYDAAILRLADGRNQLGLSVRNGNHEIGAADHDLDGGSA